MAHNHGPVREARKAPWPAGELVAAVLAKAEAEIPRGTDYIWHSSLLSMALDPYWPELDFYQMKDLVHWWRSRPGARG